MAEASVRRKDQKGVIEGVADELECAICNEHFNQPKYLQCMHTFCAGCLEDLAKSRGGRKMLPCPLCRQETPVPKDGIRHGLKTNTMAVSILEKIKKKVINGGGDAMHSDEDRCQTHQGEYKTRG